MKHNLEIKNIPVNQINAYERNPRIHDQKQIELLEKSMTEFSFTNPVLIDENNELLAGHGRLLAAKKLGLDAVPSIKIDYLNNAQKKAYRIADNQLTIKGEWDQNLLGLELKELSDLEFDLSVTGFEPTQIDLSIASLDAVEEESLNQLPKEQDTIISKQGDAWQLGKHRIICADATLKESYEILMQNKRADMIFTDAPYNVPIQKHVCGLGKIKHQEFSMASGEMTQEEFTSFLQTSFTHLRDYSKEGSLHYLCMDWRHITEITTACKAIYDEFKNLCVWNKSNAGMGSLYRSKHELIFVYKHGIKPHLNNIELGKHGRYRTNVWDYEGVNGFTRKDELSLHPTVKPVELIADAILDTTKRNNIVLDSFLGSGSTLMACEKTGRTCYGIEIEPLYIDTTIRRWQEYTGEEAIHIASNKTYHELINLNQ